MGAEVLKAALSAATRQYIKTEYKCDHDTMNDLSWALKECIETDGLGYDF